MRIVFMGTPEFSVPVLEQLVAAGHKVVAVYCQPPRPAGRGKKPRPSPVQSIAESHNLSVFTPINFKGADVKEIFLAHKADVAIVVAYGLILPQEVLDMPKFGCLNIHASLLPRWRGAAPIHRAVMAGDTETGVCIMQMEAGLDTGPVLKTSRTDILKTDTTAVLHDRLATLGSDAIVDVLENLDHLTAIPQAKDGVVYAEKVTKEEAKIDWSEPAEDVDRKIRGLSPFPGAWSTINGDRVKFLMSEETCPSGPIGTVLADDLTVACSYGSVRLLRLQRAGKAAMDAREFLRGTDVTVGMSLI